MSKKTKTKQKPNLLQIIKQIGENLKSVLEEGKEKEYFENIVLNYSLIENLLKYTVFLKMTWDQTDFDVDHDVSRKESLKKFELTRDFCANMTFYQAGEIALGINLIDYSLYQKISKIRKERNDIIHQYWLFEHKNDPKTLKGILQEEIGVSKELIEILFKLFKKIGSDGVFDTSLFFK